MKNSFKVTYVYKDFDIFNGLIATFLILGRKVKDLKFNWEICVFNYQDSEYGKQFARDGGKLVSLDAKWENNPFIIWKLFRHFRKTRPDVVQTFILKPNIYGIIAARLAKVPVIIATDLTLRDQAPTRLKRLRDNFLYPIYHFLLHWVDHVICVSEAVRAELPAKIRGARATVIHSPFDEVFLSESKDIEIVEKAKGPITIGIVGRLSEEKRHMDLFEAFSQISKDFPDVKLLVVGEGYMKKALEEQVKSLGLQHKVEFAGFQSDVIQCLKRMDLFVLPSRTEGVPLSILEAMVLGLPVIATRVGGIPELVVHNETGFLVEPGDVESLEKCMHDLLSDPGLRIRFGTEGKERVLKQFHPDNFIRSHQRIYETSLGEKVLLSEQLSNGP